MGNGPGGSQVAKPKPKTIDQHRIELLRSMRSFNDATKRLLFVVSNPESTVAEITRHETKRNEEWSKLKKSFVRNMPAIIEAVEHTSLYLAETDPKFKEKMKEARARAKEIEEIFRKNPYQLMYPFKSSVLEDGRFGLFCNVKGTTKSVSIKVYEGCGDTIAAYAEINPFGGIVPKKVPHKK